MFKDIFGFDSPHSNKNQGIFPQLWQESLCFPFFVHEDIDYSDEYIEEEENSWNFFN